jgi:hypothetical protein
MGRKTLAPYSQNMKETNNDGFQGTTMSYRMEPAQDLVSNDMKNSTSQQRTPSFNSDTTGATLSLMESFWGGDHSMFPDTKASFNDNVDFDTDLHGGSLFDIDNDTTKRGALPSSMSMLGFEV